MASESFKTFGVDSSGLRRFLADLRKASKVAAVGYRVQLIAAGEIVATEARAIASEHSEKIPPSIKTQVRGATIAVVAGQGVPLAALYEVGNAGRGSRSVWQASTTTFKHPVHGHRDRWVTQTGYPALKPAADKMMPEVMAAVGKVADDVQAVLTR